MLPWTIFSNDTTIKSNDTCLFIDLPQIWHCNTTASTLAGHIVNTSFYWIDYRLCLPTTINSIPFLSSSPLIDQPIIYLFLNLILPMVILFLCYGSMYTFRKRLLRTWRRWSLQSE